MVESSVAFTGHRPESLPFEETSPACIALKNDITSMLDTAILQGADTFYCGMAMGIDTICGEIVLQLKHHHPHIRLICVLPYQHFGQRFPESWRKRRDRLLAAAYEIVCTDVHDANEQYSRYNRYYRRNRYLIDHAATLLAIYDGRKGGGTAYTIAYARKKERTIHLLNPRSYQ